MSDLEKALALGLVAVLLNTNWERIKTITSRVVAALKPKAKAHYLDNIKAIQKTVDDMALRFILAQDEADRKHQELGANLDALNSLLTAATNNTASHEVYVQSLATLSKGISTILERQDKQEQQLILLVSSLSRLTDQ